MDVAIDANILIRDYWLGSFNIRVLFDYIRKTQSYILIHEIVKDEVRGKLKRDVLETSEEINKALKGARKRLHEKNIPLIEADSFVKAVLDKWEANFQKKMDTNIAKILPLDNTALPEAIKRAIERIPPCHQQGEQMRDAIIWLNLIEYCKKHHTVNELAFISENTNDFASKDKLSLHPVLLNDIHNNGVKILYYSSLEDFIKVQAQPIKHITFDWINIHIDLEKVENLIEQQEELYQAFQYTINDVKDRQYYVPVGEPYIYERNISLNDFYVWAFDSRIEATLDFRVHLMADIDCIHRDYGEDFYHSYLLEEDHGGLSSVVHSEACSAELHFEISVEIKGDTLTLLNVENVYDYL